ncbi:MAG: molybdate ABC transporter substrate-binding protein [Proteobacteria bacterium]|nr:MAG: molybdate ABC transporter substrate-binding protein [Pseudomonadota bacterium]
MNVFKHCSLLFVCVLISHTSYAGEVQVAVASNFTKPMQQIAKLFQAETGHEAKLSFGASGKFVAQIMNGAPFEIFLSADDTKPAKLVAEGLALANTVFTYAQGKLVLWSHDENYVDAEGQVLQSGDFKHIAVADPKLAPYGEAAMQTLDALELTDKLRERFVMGRNIGQTFQFVKTANAELGLIALSQVMEAGKMSSGSGWIIPAEYYEPIKQEAVLLKKGEKNEAALALLSFLQSDQAKAVIKSFGYKLPVIKVSSEGGTAINHTETENAKTKP